MPDTISLSSDSLYYAIRSLQFAAIGTDPTTSDIPAITSDAQTLRRYEQTIRQIGKLIQQYQTLVTKDCNALDAVHSNMVGIDNYSANQFRLQP